MNTTISQPTTNVRPYALPSMAQGMAAQGMLPRPAVISGGTNGYGPRPPVGLPGTPQAPAGTGSFLDRIVSQIEQLIERVVLSLVERVLGSVTQKLEGLLGGAAGAAGAAPMGMDPNAMALMTSMPSATAPGSVLVDLPPMQLTVNQTNSQNQTQSQTVQQPAQESGGFLSTIFDFVSGFGDKVSGIWDTVKNVGSSLFSGGAGLFNKVTSFFGF